MKESHSLLRVGRINFTNVWPVFHYFTEQLKAEVEIITQVPTSLNRAMAEGHIQLGDRKSVV